MILKQFLFISMLYMLLKSSAPLPSSTQFIRYETTIFLNKSLILVNLVNTKLKKTEVLVIWF